MDIQGQRFFDTRGFRIAVIAVAAIAILALAAYWFGTGLRADTSASVAPSPLGSSLTAVRESIQQDYVERLRNSAAPARAASPATVGESSSAHFDGSSAALAWNARLASPAVVGESRSAHVDGSSAAMAWNARLASAAAAKENRSADVYGSSSAIAWDARLASAAAAEESRSADVHGSSSTSSAVASAASLAPFYAGLDKGLRDQGIRP